LGEGNYNESYGYNSATGNLDAKAGVTLQYTDSNHKHAVTSAGGNNYTYDANGNMITRTITSGDLAGNYALSYDAENRLVSVVKNGSNIAAFVYDGDGVQVKATVNGVETRYVGSHYEITGSSITKYYFAGSTRIALRKDGVLNYTLADHLGSSSITTNANGAVTAKMLYKAWGETRYSIGDLNTKYEYTGQRNESEIGLHFYGSRWYDDQLGRYAQADSVIPQSQGVQAWDRYAYVNNSPINYRDSSGHSIECAVGGACPDIIVLSGWSDSYIHGQPDNDTCAPTSIASALSVVMGREIDSSYVTESFETPLTGSSFGGVAPWRMLLPAKPFSDKGVLPVDQAAGINSLGFGVTARFSYGNNRQSLINNVTNGVATVVTVSWANDPSYAHVLFVVKYCPSTGQLSFMDPAQGKNGEVITEYEFYQRYKVTFEDAWLNQANTGIASGSMVTVTNKHIIPISRGGGGGTRMLIN
jgi:RHS repeat-associated protein